MANALLAVLGDWSPVAAVRGCRSKHPARCWSLYTAGTALICFALGTQTIVAVQRVTRPDIATLDAPAPAVSITAGRLVGDFGPGVLPTCATMSDVLLTREVEGKPDYQSLHAGFIGSAVAHDRGAFVGVAMPQQLPAGSWEYRLQFRASCGPLSAIWPDPHETKPAIINIP